ncbi:MAG: roadblock/LC7 domain-containing protein [Candidatus Asgardarchaeum sp.]
MHLEKFDESIRKKLQSILRKIETETDLYEVSIITRDGICIASATSSTIDANENSAAVAAMLNIAQDTSKRMEQGRLIQVVVRGEKGFTIITRVGPELVLAASSRSQYKLGLYLRMLVNYAYEIASLLHRVSTEAVTPITAVSSESIKKTQPLFASIEKEAPKTTKLVSSGLFDSLGEASEAEEIPMPDSEVVTIKGTHEVETVKLPEQPLQTEPVSPVEKHPVTIERPMTVKPMKKEARAAPNVDEEERKAILEALRIIGMIGKKKS